MREVVQALVTTRLAEQLARARRHELGAALRDLDASIAWCETRTHRRPTTLDRDEQRTRALCRAKRVRLRRAARFERIRERFDLATLLFARAADVYRREALAWREARAEVDHALGVRAVVDVFRVDDARVVLSLACGHALGVHVPFGPIDERWRCPRCRACPS